MFFSPACVIITESETVILQSRGTIMLSVAVIEDDKKDAAVLCGLLTRYERESGETVRVTTFTNAEAFLTDYKPVYDAVFMDIELDGAMDGLTAAARLRKYDETVALLFVTSMAQFAIKGYEVDALDYFVKPVGYYDVKMRLDRVRRGKRTAGATVNIGVDGGVKRVLAADVYYIEVMNHTLVYHTRDGTFSCRGGSIRDLESRLEPEGFARCSISYLVNLRHCSEIRSGSVVVGGDELKITRGKRKEFVYKLAQVLGGGC